MLLSSTVCKETVERAAAALNCLAEYLETNTSLCESFGDYSEELSCIAPDVRKIVEAMMGLVEIIDDIVAYNYPDSEVDAAEVKKRLGR